MTGRVVLVERTSLSDWVRGVRAFFTRVLGISLIYLGILIIGFIPLSMIYLSFVLQLLVWQMVIAPPQITAPALLTPLSMAIMWIITLIGAVSTAVLYTWIALIVLENKGVIASLGSGNRGIREGGRTFLGFIALIFAASGVTSLIENFPVYLGAAIQQLSSQGYLTPSNIASQAISTVISPLWFLMAFTIYYGQPR